MAQERIHYEVLVQDALRNVIRKVLADVAKTGLPGEHHFFITFLTGAPGVQISPRLKERYPEQMTIVLQHQFWDLFVENDFFQVTLSFGDIPEKLVVPFSALQVFYDPAAAFEAAFDMPAGSEQAEPGGDMTVSSSLVQQLVRQSADNETADEQTTQAAADKPVADVVSLDAFRKNK